MVSQILTHPYWFWLALGGLLLSLELLGAAGYLLWSGTAACINALMVWFFPTVSWGIQWLFFAVLIVFSAILWWYWLRQRRGRKKPILLNQRNRQLLGVRATLHEPLQNRYGRLKLGDTTWRVQAQEEISTGSEVEVVAVKGITLIIKRAK